MKSFKKITKNAAMVTTTILLVVAIFDYLILDTRSLFKYWIVMAVLAGIFWFVTLVNFESRRKPKRLTLVRAIKIFLLSLSSISISVGLAMMFINVELLNYLPGTDVSWILYGILLGACSLAVKEAKEPKVFEDSNPDIEYDPIT